MTGPYDDIIHLPRPVSARHVPMSMIDRGAQFSPFAALTGFDSAIQETARLTDSCIELDENAKEMLNEKLQLLYENIDTHPCVTIVYFRQDHRKSGGAYLTVTGNAVKIDPIHQTITLSNEKTIAFDQIYEIN